jgi:hypothetical protein
MAPMNEWRSAGRAGVLLLSAALAACADRSPTAVTPPPEPQPALARYDCIASVRAASVTCRGPGASDGVRGALIGAPAVTLVTTGVAWDSATGTFAASVAVSNHLVQAIGTGDGVNPDANGIKVFFHSGPVVTSGWGSVTVSNPDGVGTFTGAGQPYFLYPGILHGGETSAPRSWQFHLDPDVAYFGFTVFVAAATEARMVISEIMAHPTTAVEASGEWFELYNPGPDPVNLNGWTIASSGDPIVTVLGAVVVPAKGSVVLGRSTDPAANGGAGVVYAYPALDLANGTFDWLALHAPDGITVDSVEWGAATGETPPRRPPAPRCSSPIRPSTTCT